MADYWDLTHFKWVAASDIVANMTTYFISKIQQNIYKWTTGSFVFDTNAKNNISFYGNIQNVFFEQAVHKLLLSCLNI